MELGDVINQIAGIFRISPSILEFPGVITNLIIPFIFFTYLLKSLILDKYVRIFPSGINLGIACVISLISLLWISTIGFFIAIVSIIYFCYKKIREHVSGIKGTIIGIIIGIIFVILYMNIPAIINLIMSFIPGY
jgi:hypothetical protein